MPTLFAVYNLIDKLKADEYDQYLTNTKIPGIRGAPWCTAFDTWKIDKALAPAVSEPEGEMPSESPYISPVLTTLKTVRYTKITCTLAKLHKAENVKFGTDSIGYYRLPLYRNLTSQLDSCKL